MGSPDRHPREGLSQVLILGNPKLRGGQNPVRISDKAFYFNLIVAKVDIEIEHCRYGLSHSKFKPQTHSFASSVKNKLANSGEISFKVLVGPLLTMGQVSKVIFSPCEYIFKS